MIVFECIGKAWHAGMRYPAHWPAYTIVSCKRKKIWPGILLALLKPRGNSEQKMEERRGAYGGTYLAALSQLHNLSLRVYVACCHGPLCDLPLRPLLLRRHPLT
jgi:hypothetical protein